MYTQHVTIVFMQGIQSGDECMRWTNTSLGREMQRRRVRRSGFFISPHAMSRFK